MTLELLMHMCNNYAFILVMLTVICLLYVFCSYIYIHMSYVQPRYIVQMNHFENLVTHNYCISYCIRFYYCIEISKKSEGTDYNFKNHYTYYQYNDNLNIFFEHIILTHSKYMFILILSHLIYLDHLHSYFEQKFNRGVMFFNYSNLLYPP